LERNKYTFYKKRSAFLFGVANTKAKETVMLKAMKLGRISHSSISEKALIGEYCN